VLFHDQQAFLPFLVLTVFEPVSQVHTKEKKAGVLVFGFE
jgi:hypothetical protein